MLHDPGLNPVASATGSRDATLVAGRLDWLDALKGMALIGILLNHLVEQFGPGPWFTRMSGWFGAGTRWEALWPAGPFPIDLIRFLGWLGDGAPGVFILVSGVGLALAAARRDTFDTADFYRRRLRRLFPLYIACHFAILGAAALLPGALPSFGDPRTLFSLTGVRSTDATFFWISPSWWFVWTILQLYLAFPLLWWLLYRHGTPRFLVLCLLLTFAARGIGLAAAPNLYFWMTGIFAGTRLAEFAVGMAIGVALAKDPESLRAWSRRAIPAGLILWTAGVAAAFTPTGAIVSYLLVTAGMSATGYGVWQFLRRWRASARTILWIGSVSFAVFLLHQPPLEWTGLWWPGATLPHLAAALVVVVLIFPAAVLVERLAARMAPPSRLTPEALTAVAWVASITVIAGTAAGFLVPAGGRGERLFQWVLAAVLMLLVVAVSRAPTRLPAPVRDWALGAGVTGLFFLPLTLGPAAVAIGLIYAAAGAILSRIPFRRHLRAVAAGGVTALILIAAEVLLIRGMPAETGVWGERPALETHPTRGYGLKPSRTTRLRYRHSDYEVTTNSLGLASPEIPPVRENPSTWRLLVVGDAFAMPEGLPYDASFPALLQQSLERCMARPVQVINGGVTGYGPVEELAQMRDLVPLLTPDVVIHQFFVNEWKEIHIGTEERQRDIGLTRPREFLLDRFLRTSQLAARTRGLTGQEPPWESRWGLLQYYTDEGYYSHSLISAMRDTLARMAGVARAGGSRYMIFNVPAAVIVSPLDSLAYVPQGFRLTDVPSFDPLLPTRALRQATAGLGIEVVELGRALREHPRQPVYDRRAWYWNREGHRVAANEMLRILVEAGEIPDCEVVSGKW